MAGPHSLDARGLRCPWPALRLARAMRDHDRVAITADDPAVSSELRQLAVARGWDIEQTGDEPACFLVSRG